MARKNVFTRLTVIAGTGLLFISCGASTKFQNTWLNPEAKPLQFKKVLVLVISPDESIRQAVENRMAAKFKRAEGIASHTILSKQEIDNVELAKAKVKGMGIDGAVTLQAVRASEKTKYVASRYYPDPYAFWNYYSYAWPTVFESGFVDATRIVQVETKIFSLADEKMIWAGISESSDPSGLRKLVDEVAEAAAYELKKQKLID